MFILLLIEIVQYRTRKQQYLISKLRGMDVDVDVDVDVDEGIVKGVLGGPKNTKSKEFLCVLLLH